MRRHGQDSIVICIVSRQAAIFRADYDVDCACKLRRGAKLVEIRDYGLFVWDGDVDAAERLIPQKRAEFIGAELPQLIRNPGETLMDYLRETVPQFLTYQPVSHPESNSLYQSRGPADRILQEP